MTFTGCEDGAVVPAEKGGVSAVAVTSVDFDAHVDRRVIGAIRIEFLHNSRAIYSRFLKAETRL